MPRERWDEMQQEKSVYKPMLDVEGQVQHLKDKGITFQLVNEEEAKEYLRNNNYYFKLTSYRKNYEKYEDGDNEGKYISLDFGYLKDLAIIDMDLRYMLAQLSFDIEHYTKIELLRLVEDLGEDGYAMCEDFIKSQTEDQRNRLMNEINRNENSVYCGDLFSRYPENFPLWVFLELIPFGRLVSFYGFCAIRFQDKKMKNKYFMLKTCKDIRNAAAHSSCIINDLKADTAQYDTSYEVLHKLARIKSVSKNVREKKMSNARVQQIVTLLYVYEKIVTSKGVQEKAVERLRKFEERMMRNIEYYQDNDMIRTNFEFLKLVIDNWHLNV